MLSRVGKMLPGFSGGSLYGAGYPAGQVLGGETSGFAIDFTSPGANLLMRSGTIPGNYVGYPFVREGGPVAFSRASNATVTDSNGYIKWAAHNLLLASEQFDSAGWTKTSTTVTANNAAAPNGTTSADKIAFNNATSGTVYQAISKDGAALTYTVGVYAKASGYNWLRINVWDAVANGTSFWFDLSTGAKGSTTNSGVGFTNTSYTISSVGGGWYYCTATFTTNTGTALRTVLYPTNADAATTNGNGTDGILVWGAHLYRSDLGGMVANTSAYPMYNPTTPKNLLGYTESFNNTSGWTVTDATVTADATVSPTGLTTGDAVFETATTAVHGVLISANATTVSGTKYVASVYAKANGRNYCALLDSQTGVGKYFDLVNGTVLGDYNASPPAAASITSVGNGWYRCSITITATTALRFRVYISDTGSTASYAGDTSKGIYVWGAQLSDSASLDTYVANNFAAPSAAAFNGPRFDYDPSTLAAKGLLVEEQRTNFFTNSNVPSAGTGVSVTANASTSPDGTTTAYRIAKTDATTPRYISRSTSMTAGSNSAYTVSAWYKYDGYGTNVSLEYNSSNNWGVDWVAIFSVASTGVSVSSTLNCSAAVQNYGNGWYKVIVTFTSGASPSSPSNPLVLSRITGASGVSVLGYGAQLEAGSFATSYIPTTSATVTRSADVAQVSTQAFPYNATAGTLVAAWQQLGPAVSGAFYNVAALRSDANNRVNLYVSGTAMVPTAASRTAGVTDFTSAFAAISANSQNKIGIALIANDAIAACNGVLGTQDASVAVPAVDTMPIGSDGSAPLNGHIRQITYIPRRLSNAELQSRTA